jgi:GNAT superfamily N-acetyltransferase
MAYALLPTTTIDAIDQAKCNAPVQCVWRTRQYMEKPLTVAIVRNLPIVNEELNALRSASWTQVGDQDWEPILKRSLGWVCATDGDRLIGFVNIAWDGGVHAFLLDTTVHPDYQRHGIGRALVKEAASMAQERGAEWLHVDYDDELDAFYRGCGFRPTPAGLINLTALAPVQPT